MKKNDVVQFNENHEWCGCLGIITEVKKCGDDVRYMVNVHIPVDKYTCIFVMDSDGAIEYIGKAVMVPVE